MKAFTLFRRLFTRPSSPLRAFRHFAASYRFAFLFVIFFPLWGTGGLFAQDTIQLTWQGGTNKLIGIDYSAWTYPFSFPIRVNWGDGFITDTIAEHYSFSGYLTHSYADTTRNYAVTITSYSDTVLVGFYCQYLQVSRLDISRCAVFYSLTCIGNLLPLSELYKISEKDPYHYPQGFMYGIQHLLPQRMLVGDSVDFSDQAEFGDTATVFNVEKNGIPAALNKIIPFTMV